VVLTSNSTLTLALFPSQRGLVPLSTPPSLLSIEDFPALTSSSSLPAVHSNDVFRQLPITNTTKTLERKAVKKVVPSHKVSEKQRVVKEIQDDQTIERTNASLGKAVEVVQTLTTKEVDPEPEEHSHSQGSLASTPPLHSSSQTKQGVVMESSTTSKKASKSSNTNLFVRRSNQQVPSKSSKSMSVNKSTLTVDDTTCQVPLLSKRPKKNKPVVKAFKIPKDDDPHEEISLPSLTDTPKIQGNVMESSATNSRSQSRNRFRSPTSMQTLLEQLDAMYPALELFHHPFFDSKKLVSSGKMPLEYGPLVHALSALSVGGGSFANSIPTGSIDNAVSSFQQLLETLTQTISDLLRLLPRTTWDDSSSFDGVLRDMLKGDDFLDDNTDNGAGKDEVAALTLALERRARWMEVQLSKLEELHRDINTAAVKAVFSLNDNGWDKHSFLPCNGDSLTRFNAIGIVEQGGIQRPMTADELEKQLIEAKETAMWAETEIRENIEKYQFF
jgi:CCR4-NOT transcription complex subunit 4